MACFHRVWTWSLILACLAWAASNAHAGQPAASLTLDFKGARIHYLQSGPEKPSDPPRDPVVLIHGLHANAGLNWHAPGIVDALAVNHRVIALDLPGHGFSDKPQADEFYGQALVDLVVALMDHAQVQRAHVVGYSLGGMIALKLATQHPQRVRSLTLGGMGWLREGSRMQDYWATLPAEDRTRTPDACMRGIAQLAVTAESIKALDLPARMIVGDRDPVRRLYVTPLQRLRPDWSIVEILDAGHLNCITKPAFGKAIVNWINYIDKKSATTATAKAP
jgi:pimeloyl-ACP methyl ester carboxylesterase